MSTYVVSGFAWKAGFVSVFMVHISGAMTELAYSQGSVQFPEKVTCFVRDSDTGNLYVQTQGNITKLDSKFRLVENSAVAELAPITEIKNNKSENFKGNQDNECLINDSRLFDSNASVFGRLSRPQRASALDAITDLTLNTSILDRVLLTVRALNKSYAIGVKGHETWMRNIDRNTNVSGHHDFTLRCKAPNFKRNGFITFQEASSAVLIEKQENSSSLFVLFVVPSKKLSVICEYPFTSKIIFNHTLWESSIASTILPSVANGFEYMHFYGKEILIIREQHDIKMLWLPLVNNTVQPQRILPSNFGDDTNYDEFELPNITGMAANGNQSEVLVATDYSLTLVPLDKCSQYKNCTQCLRSTDSPCGWCTVTKQCVFLQFCKMNSSISTEDIWADSRTSSEDYCFSPLPRSTTIRRFTVLPPKKNSLAVRKIVRSEARNVVSLSVPSSTYISLQPSVPPMMSESSGPGTINKPLVVLGITAALSVVLTVMIAVNLVKYLKIRKANIATANGFQAMFPEFRGIRSYKQVRDMLQRQRLQREHTRLNQEPNVDEPDSSTSI